MHDQPLTQLLGEIKAGRAAVTADLLPLVYDQMRGLARGMMKDQPESHTLQPTALVNEACAKLLGSAELSIESRAHFFAIAATAMRQVLADHAKAKRAEKRTPQGKRVTLAGVPGESGVGRVAGAPGEVDMLALDDALTKLAGLDPRQARLIELRFFGGMTVAEAAIVMEVSVPTLEREWRAAKAFLRNELGRAERGIEESGGGNVS
jgi:RNA polymerase sigma factor (TIGR02999 family)